MLKIGIVITSFPGISETFILNQIKGLIDAGCNVTIFAFEKNRLQKQHDYINAYDIEKIITYASEKSKFKIYDFLVAALKLAASFHKNPFAVLNFIKCFLKREKGLSIKSVSLLTWAINQKNPIIHCHYGTNGVAALLLKKCKINFILGTVFHGNDITGIPVAKGPNYYDSLFAHGDLFLPVSNYLKQKLINRGCPEDKIYVHHMGIDIETFSFNSEVQNKNDSLTFLTVGRLVEKKGHIYALKALAKIKDKLPDFNYLIAGDGPLKNQLQLDAKKLDLSDNVNFLGIVNRKEVIELLKTSTIFLLPSVTAQNGDKEGLPVVLMEALASGIPVIASKHSGIPEIINDGNTGLLFQEKDVTKLAEKVLFMINNTEVTKQLIRNGSQLVKKEFHEKKLVALLIDIYQSK